jgi:two-component system, chemotaxis family, sensor kinase CheA
MIDNLELRELFSAESEEHLQKLDENLLHLEKSPDDMAVLEESFREAHSMKGAARMLGLDEIVSLSHYFEDQLGAASRGEISFDGELVDRMTSALDDIRAFVNSAITGEEAQVSITDAMARLTTPGKADVESDAPLAHVEEKEAQEEEVTEEEEVSEDEKLTEKEEAQEEEAQEEETVPPAHIPAQPPAQIKAATTANSESEQQIKTIRVETRKLDQLLNQVSELTVSKNRIKRRLSELEELIEVWESYSISSRAVKEDAKEESYERLDSLIGRMRNAMVEDATGLELNVNELEERTRTLRLLPFSTLFSLFPRTVRDLARQQDKQINLIIDGGDTSADKQIIEEMKNPLTHIIRNAIDHGMETPQERKKSGKPPEGSIHLKAFRTATNVVIEISDDGRGLDTEKIKQKAIKQNLCSQSEMENLIDQQIHSFIFSSEFSTSEIITDISGRGVGLDAAHTGVDNLKGSINVTSTTGGGTCFSIQLPTTLTSTPTFIVAAASELFAVPIDFVHGVRHISQTQIYNLEGRQTISLNGNPLTVVRLSELLHCPGTKACVNDKENLDCLILEAGESRLGVIVDAVVEELDVVIKPLASNLPKVPNVAGATILGNGEVCMVLNPKDLIQTVRKSAITVQAKKSEDDGNIESQETESPNEQQHLLLAEDSITTRIQMKRILEGEGYIVETAVDGLEAFNKLNRSKFDAVLTDVEMPNMTGLELCGKIRKNKAHAELPVILITSLSSDDDRRRGMDVGANAYISKGTFEQQVMLDTLRRLL